MYTVLPYTVLSCTVLLNKHSTSLTAIATSNVLEHTSHPYNNKDKFHVFTTHILIYTLPKHGKIH